MQKIFGSIVLTAAILITSCTKEKSGTHTVDSQKVHEVISTKSNPATMVVVFNILNPAEKAFAFKKHIADSYKNLSLNNRQIEFVRSIIEIIVPEMYMNDQKDKYAGVLAKFGYEATKLFSIKDYAYLFENISTVEPTLNNPTGPGDCYCNWNSTCQAYADTAGPDCIEGLDSCTQTSSGCGFLWLSPCKGKCGRKPV